MNLGNSETSRVSNRDYRDLKGVNFLVEPNRHKFHTQSDSKSEGSGTLDAAGDLLTFPPTPRPLREDFNALQKWEGYVTEVGDDVFQARLIPIMGQGSEQEAEIYITEVSKGDRAMIKPGAVFYWSIGYLEKPSGRIRASVIRFRRLPKWTAKEIEVAENRAKALKELLSV
jgi:hypothetical protein